MKKKSTYLLFYFLLGIGSVLTGQNSVLNDALEVALKHINANLEKLGLTNEDIQDYVISDQYKNSVNDATHLYLRQRYQGVEVYNAILNVTLDRNNKIIFVGNRYVNGLKDKINTTTPTITPLQAVEAAAQQLNVGSPQNLEILQSINTREVTVTKSSISLEVIPVKLMFQPMKDGTVKLAWDLSIYTTNAQHWWSVRVDAQTGTILDKTDWVIKCQHGSFINQTRATRKANLFSPFHGCTEHTIKNLDGGNQTNMVGTYNVFAMPIESPSHGSRSLVNDPEELTASPFGWHDIDGVDGPEYTITRGNNVHAYADWDTLSPNQSSGDEPDGGATLNFDYALDLTLEPENYRDAAVTNLFYWNNLMHDVWYQYGFDEPAGNFQFNNYGKGGASTDPVLAEAQDASGLNNANFATPVDGDSPRMQMFRWVGSESVLTVNTGSAAGGYEAQPAGFGASIDTINLTAELVLVDDGTFNGSQGCNTLANANDVVGKIAVIDRGTCEFGIKSLNAQNAGALAVIVCNNELSSLITMAAGDSGDLVTIPALFLGKIDCEAIKISLQSGTPVQATITEPVAGGPDSLDASFDNGVIAHEYGHGITNRLVGGPSAAGCFANLEQQGEGWSDWFSLVMTVEPDDLGTDKRGIGTYSVKQDVNGRGIRTTAYSTDRTIDPKTFNSTVLETIPHGVGSVWGSMIWDLYWAFVEEYGFDPDIYHGTGGNNMAMQLVMDGLKIQPCNSSFIDARDAILAADNLNNDGANQLLIWQVFASRGLGYSASSGNRNNVLDAVEAFDLPIDVFNNIHVTKTAPREIEAGTSMTYTLDLVNFSDDTLTNVTITDTLADNLTFIAGGAGCNVVADGNIVSINVGTMLPNDILSCSFDVDVAFGPHSTVQYMDSVEDATISSLEWISVSDVPTINWEVVQTNPNSGSSSWYVPIPDEQSDISLASVNAYTITGTKPALRFFHNFNIPYVIEAGLVEVSTDFTNWVDAGQYAITGSYRGAINSGGLVIAPGRNGFYGNSGGYQETLIDLTPFLGQSIHFRFRMVSSDSSSIFTNGWYIDDISLIDLVMTPNTATVSNDQNVVSAGEVANGGTIIMPSSTSTRQALPTLNAQIFPNPTESLFNIQLSGDHSGDLKVRVLGIEGRTLLQHRFQNVAPNQTLPVNIKDFAAGIYFVELLMDSGIVVKKLVVRE